MCPISNKPCVKLTKPKKHLSGLNFKRQVSMTDKCVYQSSPQQGLAARLTFQR